MTSLGQQQLSTVPIGAQRKIDFFTTLATYGKPSAIDLQSNSTDVLDDGFDTRDVRFDSDRLAFVTDWQYETQWTDAEIFSVRIISDGETNPIKLRAEYSDTNGRLVTDSSDWKRVTANDTPILFESLPYGAGSYRILLRNVRKQDRITDIKTGFVSK